MSNTSVRLFMRSIAVCCLALAAGCGGDDTQGPTTYIIAGTVKFDDGTPLSDGTILFTPVDGQSNPAQAEIKDGMYETQATIGTKTVSVSQLKVVGTETINVPTNDGGKGPTVEIKEEQVAREFSERSTVTFEVKDVEKNEFDLTVKRADPNAKPLSQPF